MHPKSFRSYLILLLLIVFMLPASHKGRHRKGEADFYITFTVEDFTITGDGDRVFAFCSGSSNSSESGGTSFPGICYLPFDIVIVGLGVTIMGTSVFRDCHISIDANGTIFGDTTITVGEVDTCTYQNGSGINADDEGCVQWSHMNNLYTPAYLPAGTEIGLQIDPGTSGCSGTQLAQWRDVLVHVWGRRVD